MFVCIISIGLGWQQHSSIVRFSIHPVCWFYVFCSVFSHGGVLRAEVPCWNVGWLVLFVENGGDGSHRMSRSVLSLALSTLCTLAQSFKKKAVERKKSSSKEVNLLCSYIDDHLTYIYAVSSLIAQFALILIQVIIHVLVSFCRMSVWLLQIFSVQWGLQTLSKKHPALRSWRHQLHLQGRLLSSTWGPWNSCLLWWEAASTSHLSWASCCHFVFTYNILSLSLFSVGIN